MPAARKKTKKTSTSGKSNKKKFSIPLTTLSIVLFLATTPIIFRATKTPPSQDTSLANIQQKKFSSIDLPYPNKDSKKSLEKVLAGRRSYRNFQNKPLSLNNLSQLLWSAQGVTTNWGGRTVPSFRSAYPLNIYAIANQVKSLDPGLYKYNPGEIQPAHQLYFLYKADFKSFFLENANQYSLQHAPLILVITGNMDKMAEKYEGKRKDINVYLEAGHVAQNLFLQSESLGLGMAEIRTFNQDLLKETLKIPEEETIIYLIPVGHPKK